MHKATALTVLTPPLCTLVLILLDSYYIDHGQHFCPQHFLGNSWPWDGTVYRKSLDTYRSIYLKHSWKLFLKSQCCRESSIIQLPREVQDATFQIFARRFCVAVGALGKADVSRRCLHDPWLHSAGSRWLSGVPLVDSLCEKGVPPQYVLLTFQF